MWDLREIAVLEEGRQAVAISDVAREWVPLGGGRMSRGEPGTWVNAAVGVGLAGPVSGEEVDRMIAWYREMGLEPRIEVCPFVDPSLREQLEARGFVVRVFENALFRELRADETVRPVFPLAPGIEVRQIDPGDPRQVREYGVTVATGFAGGQEAREADIDLMARCAVHERTTAFGAFVDGRCVAGGGLEIAGEASALFGLSVLEPFRRRGIQQALIAARLNVAAGRGAKIATIGSRPGVPTERNVRRMGFQVAYTKVAMVLPGAGLARVVEL
jgi:GNAT superfamily N-acetyltransferase